MTNNNEIIAQAGDCEARSFQVGAWGQLPPELNINVGKMLEVIDAFLLMENFPDDKVLEISVGFAVIPTVKMRLTKK
jgi:hypothetical protein